MEKLKVKRQLVVKTIVTEGFKKRAADEMMQELKLVDDQINHLQIQLNSIIQEIKQGSGGVNVLPREAEQIINDLNLKLQQLMNFKQNLQVQTENINKTQDGDVIVTGSLENYVDLNIGDNIYDKLLNKEIIVKDGIIQDIKHE